MKFRVLEWVRKVRDEDYKNTKHMSAKEKINHVRKRAEEFKKKLKPVKA